MVRKVISDILCSPLIGRMIYNISGGNIRNIRYRQYTFRVPVKQCSYKIVSSIFWGFYEAAETRLIRKYLLPDIPVIELGSSLGIVSSFAISRLNNTSSFIGVEANSKIFDTIESNIRNHNLNLCPYKILNKAISYSDSYKFLHTSSNSTHSYLVDKQVDQANDIPVECTKLIDIVKLAGLNEFTLISDIEGSEIELLLKDSEALRFCRSMIIELHETEWNGKRYCFGDIVAMIRNYGFDLGERDGNVFFFSKPVV